MSRATHSRRAGALRRFRPYLAYKDSGVEWLGEIPARWNAKRLKFVAAEPIKNGIGEAGAYDDPGWPRYVRITDIAGPRQLREDTFKSLPPALAREAPFGVGDLLLAAVGATFGKSYLHVREIGPACFAGYMVRFSPNREAEPGFVAYWTESSVYWALVQSRVVQATIQNFSAAKYKELSLPLPSLDEQRAIAAFLDRETAKIDALVARNERLIELLHEKRAALITRAVTKGLDPTVPMKDSGVEWLGETPKHWSETRLRLLVEERKDRNWDCGRTAFLSLISGRGVIPYEEKGNLGNKKSEDIEKYVLVEPGDFVINSMNFGIGGFGVSDLRGITSPAYVVLRPKGKTAVAGYLRLVFQHRGFQDAVAILGNGIMDLRRAIRWDELKNQVIPFPPLAEQERIVQYIDTALAEADVLAVKVHEAIDRLKELRTALISAAVTGKIDVREEVA